MQVKIGEGIKDDPRVVIQSFWENGVPLVHVRNIGTCSYLGI